MILFGFFYLYGFVYLFFWLCLFVEFVWFGCLLGNIGYFFFGMFCGFNVLFVCFGVVNGVGVGMFWLELLNIILVLVFKLLLVIFSLKCLVLWWWICLVIFIVLFLFVFSFISVVWLNSIVDLNVLWIWKLILVWISCSECLWLNECIISLVCGNLCDISLIMWLVVLVLFMYIVIVCVVVVLEVCSIFNCVLLL